MFEDKSVCRLAAGSLFLAATVVLAGPPQTYTVTAGDNDGLIAAVEGANSNPGSTIEFQQGPGGEMEFIFAEAYNGGDNALPVIVAPVRILAEGVSFQRAQGAPQFRFVEIGISDTETKSGFPGYGPADFEFRGGTVEEFSSPDIGGGILANGSFEVEIVELTLQGNSAGLEGGGVALTGESHGHFSRVRLVDNTAGQWGSGLSINTSSERRSRFSNIAIYSSSGGPNAIENPFGAIRLENTSTWGGDIIQTVDDAEFGGNAWYDGFPSPLSKRSATKIACQDFGTGAITSLGYNIVNDGSCFLDQPTDMPNTDPLFAEIAEPGVIPLQAGSPAIDAGPAVMMAHSDGETYLPCGHADIRGLGRPQDANSDGVFECDIGAYEVQGGEDISAPASGGFFATARDGEGVFVEILDGGLAIIYFYTYSVDGTELLWFAGLGEVVGNSVVIDEVYRVSGSEFGSGFDPDDIERTRVGSMSLVYPDCESESNPGVLNFVAGSDSGFESLLQENKRLSTLVDCSGTPASPDASRSGSFYDRNRSGEGIQVQWLSDGRVLIIFFTVDADGNAFWTISDIENTVVNGDTVNAPMLYPAGRTSFGSNFDSSEISLESWGTVTATYTSDDTIDFSHSSPLPGFGDGSYGYDRITQPAGTD